MGGSSERRPGTPDTPPIAPERCDRRSSSRAGGGPPPEERPLRTRVESIPCESAGPGCSRNECCTDSPGRDAAQKGPEILKGCHDGKRRPPSKPPLVLAHRPT